MAQPAPVGGRRADLAERAVGGAAAQARAVAGGGGLSGAARRLYESGRLRVAGSLASRSRVHLR